MSGPAPRTALLAAAALALAACGDAGPEGGPGTLTARLVSPAGAEGAAWVELVGPGVEAVAPADARAFGHRRGDTLRVVVVRDEPGELRFLLEVRDTTRVPSAVVLEVADGENRLRADLTGYTVELRP